jgi:conjugative relaxase-like TrwC/TraI family protein
MIRITQQDSASGAKRYYATADYYSEGQELIGSWGGQGAARLGLEGKVDKLSFERLCDNLHPQTADQLTVRTHSDRTVGYDFTFSVPKSVSLLYGLTGDVQILDAFRSAVDDTMREMEAEMKTRVRRKGEDKDRTTGNMVWAEFIHTTSRPVDGVPDPQLHAHCFVFNTTWDQDEERWKAGQFRELKRDAPYFQAAFRVRLANRLQDLGFGVERKRDDFEIAGIPKDVLGRFSRRTAQIEERAAELGITNPDRKAELGAETREHKNNELTTEELRRDWEGRITATERHSLEGVYSRATPYARPERVESMAVDYALGHSFTRDAVLPERKLLTEALKRGLGAVTVEDTAAELKKRPLIRSEVDGRAMATTKEMLALESKLIDFARQGRGRHRPMGDAQQPITRDWFNEGQKAAVRHVLGSRDRVMIIRGVAGTGKTTLEQEIGERLADSRKPVVALAQSVKARDVLRDQAGFASAETVAMFLKSEPLQQSANGGVILVDEASLLGTRDMSRLFEVAETANARVLLVGDRRQHRSVTAGEPLRLLEEKAGLKVAEVTEILRQSGDYKKAAKALSQGRTADAFAEFDRLKWIREVPDENRNQQLAEAYLAAVSEKKKNGEYKTALVVSPTHVEGSRVTQAIRAGLKAYGKLGQEREITAWVPLRLTNPQKADATEYEAGYLVQFQQNAKGHAKGSRLIVEEGVKPPIDLAERFEVFRPVPLAVAPGDRVRITAGGKTKDGKHRLTNGAILTVEGFTQRGDLIVDHGWIIDREFGHLTHGYVATSYAGQGDTVNKVFVAIASESLPATNQRTAYVALTRGKEQAVIFTDDREALLKAVSKPDEPLSATQLDQSANGATGSTGLLDKPLALARRLATIVRESAARNLKPERSMDHDR